MDSLYLNPKQFIEQYENWEQASMQVSWDFKKLQRYGK